MSDKRNGTNGRTEGRSLKAELQTQLELQRRILESVAARDREIRELRSDLGRSEEHVWSTSAQERIEALESVRSDLRERLLDARDRILRLEDRIEGSTGESVDHPGSPGASQAATAHSLGGVDEAAHAPERFAACTIVSRNYLAQARVLIQSLAEHEPAAPFYLLVVDGLPDGVDVGDEVVLVDYSELPVPEPYEMCFKYGIVEFNTAVKPYFLSLLMEKYGEEAVMYFDPDISVQRPLDELRESLACGDIVLTPHITQPIPRDGRTPSESDILVSGVYNLGFIALRRSQETLRFLRWWEDRLEDGCRIDVSNGLFTDQKWIDLAPGLFPSTHILRDPTYNVAFWNLHERTVTAEADRYLVNGRPAAFFHISGFDPATPELLSKHQTRTRTSEHPALARLLDEYATRLLDAGYRETQGWEYGFSRFANGVPIHELLRRLYLQLSPGQRRAFGNPFEAGGEGCFLEWATRPRPELGGLSYFLDAVYRARVDLADAFPDVRGRDRDVFVHWARTQGPIEMRYDAELVGDPESAEVEGPDVRTESGGSIDSVAPVGSLRTKSDPRHYEYLVDRIRAIVGEAIPTGATLSIVSRGDYRLTHQAGRLAWHFPRTEQGLYVGYHPRDSAWAIEHIETQRSQGSEFLVIPATAAWWLDYYDDFRVHLEDRYARVVDHPDVCVIYALRPHDRADTAWSAERDLEAGARSADSDGSQPGV